MQHLCIARLLIFHRIYHVFIEDTVPGIGGADGNVGHRSDQFAVLEDGTPGHE